MLPGFDTFDRFLCSGQAELATVESDDIRQFQSKRNRQSWQLNT